MQDHLLISISHKYTSQRAVTCDTDISPTTPLKFNRK